MGFTGVSLECHRRNTERTYQYYEELQIKNMLLKQTNKAYLSYFGHIDRRTGETENLCNRGEG